MRDCERVEGVFIPYLEGETAPKERERLLSHLESCMDCRKELEIYKMIVSRLSFEEKGDGIDGDFVQETLRRIWMERLKRRSLLEDLMGLFYLRPCPPIFLWR